MHLTKDNPLRNNHETREDGIQAACAAITQLDVIVTRNRSDFVNLDIPVLTVADRPDQHLPKTLKPGTE